MASAQKRGSTDDVWVDRESLCGVEEICVYRDSIWGVVGVWVDRESVRGVEKVWMDRESIWRVVGVWVDRDGWNLRNGRRHKEVRRGLNTGRDCRTGVEQRCQGKLVLGVVPVVLQFLAEVAEKFISHGNVTNRVRCRCCFGLRFCFFFSRLSLQEALEESEVFAIYFGDDSAIGLKIAPTGVLFGQLVVTFAPLVVDFLKLSLLLELVPELFVLV